LGARDFVIAAVDQSDEHVVQDDFQRALTSNRQTPAVAAAATLAIEAAIVPLGSVKACRRLPPTPDDHPAKFGQLKKRAVEVPRQ
jgi:hypothetical protein